MESSLSVGSNSVKTTSSTTVCPPAISISLKPCAAPLLSTLPFEEVIVCINQARKSGNLSSPKLLVRLPTALEAVVRTSGMGSNSTSFKSNNNVSKYGRKSAGVATIVVILPVINAAYLFVIALRSLKPRCKIGLITAKLGASIACRNSVAMSVSNARGVFSPGSVRAASSVGVIDAISGLRMTLQRLSRADWAAALTRGWVSEKDSVSFGTSFGRQLDSCLGARWDILPSMVILATFVRQVVLSSSNAVKTLGRISFTPCADN
mmetsp:Transcript_2385/g.3137  ORF Transcript_2385/g.3137 Transcript_2385/m.3137 type:complete len:264 (-) Transcript_2385:4949-5740(-)